MLNIYFKWFYVNFVKLQDILVLANLFFHYLLDIVIFSSLFFPDIIRSIKDPEKPYTLEDLNVVYEDGVEVLKVYFYFTRNKLILWCVL